MGPLPLDEVGNVGRQLLNHGVVEALDVLKHPLVILADEVDGHTLAAKASRAANTVQVILRLGGQVIVDDQRHLRYKTTFSGGWSYENTRASHRNRMCSKGYCQVQ